MPRRLTHEQFMERFMKKNSNANNIEILGTYVNNKTKIKCRCKIDKHIWEITPSDLLNNHGCPICGGKMKKTHKEFIKELKEINSNIEVLEQYVNRDTKIKCKCKIDGYEWEVLPGNLLNNHGCPKCKINKHIEKTTKTHEQFIKELEEINSDIEVLSTYVNSHTKIKVKCKIDGYIWEVIPFSLLRGIGCPKCCGRYKTTEEFIKELEEVNSDIEVLGQYKGSHTKIKVKCKIDGNEWEVRPGDLLQGRGCPKCNSSKGEKRISKYLKNNKIDFIPQHTFKDCKYKNVLLFDFYIPSLNMAIEFDGEQHFRPVGYFGGEKYFKVTQLRDNIKTEYCEKNNIKLIRIPFWDFDNIEGILKNLLI